MDEEDGDEDEEQQRQKERSCKFNPVYDKRSSQIRSTPPLAGNVNRKKKTTIFRKQTVVQILRQ